MTITLSPELETLVRREVESGRYDSADEYVADAVALLQERRQFFGEPREEFDRKLEESLAECERGDVITVEELRQNMAEMKAEWIAQRRSA